MAGRRLGTCVAFRSLAVVAVGDAPLNELLRWVIEQVNFGNWTSTVNAEGEVTTLTVGQAAAADAGTTTIDEVLGNMNGRLRSVNLAGVFARAREEGTSPGNVEVAETVRLASTEDGYFNAEVHYAFELADILARIRHNSFVFRTPPTVGVASANTVTMLREATRAYLFNLRRSCVSICRALLEDILKLHVSASAVLTERAATKAGELQALIDLSARSELLNEEERKKAHRIRKAGNWALHGNEPSDETAWGILLDTREVVEAVCRQHSRSSGQPGHNQE
ncbi:MAG TPA: DUF4145 domain-containing protein [Vicinamibacterales bacterium]|nr:DUF4145 domain-containing protein [Vicinamibacterales bacterium]